MLYWIARKALGQPKKKKHKNDPIRWRHLLPRGDVVYIKVYNIYLHSWNFAHTSEL